jgi:hypothetical protein
VSKARVRWVLILFMATQISSATPSTLWRCAQCSETFNTKGKRDAHNKSAHCVMISAEYFDGTKDTVFRTDGHFVCRCGNKYTHPGSLVRHAKQCQERVPLLRTQVLHKSGGDERILSEAEIHGTVTNKCLS